MTLGISRIFRSTDAGAPVLNNSTVGDLNKVLKAVLVNGYGSTQSLGWTLEYDVSNVVVFRMKSGTRMYIRFNDTDYNSLGHTEVSAFSTMSSINNGTERIPMAGTFAFIQKYSSTWNNRICPWIIVGDEAGFWLFASFWPNAGASYNNRFSAYYFGDYNAWDVRNKWNFVLLASNAATPPAIGNLHIHLNISAPNSTYKRLVARGATLSPGCEYVGISSPHWSSTYFGQSPYAVNFSYYNFLLNGAPVGAPIRIYTYNTTISPNYIIMGNLPGVFDPFGTNASESTTLENTQKIEYIDSAGELTIYMFLVNTGTNLNTSDKILVKVGKGFRNVQ